MALPAGETFLVLSSMGTPLYSARGLHQTLTPIPQAGFLLRDINGGLCNLSDANFAKYASTVTGEDQLPPAFNDVWPGTIVEVSCVAYLTYTGGSPTRPVASGSAITEADGSVRYRPVLNMMVTGFETDEDEWGATVNWTLSLEEV